MGKSTISMVMFNSKLLNYQRVNMDTPSMFWIELPGLESPLHEAIYHRFKDIGVDIQWLWGPQPRDVNVGKTKAQW